MEAGDETGLSKTPLVYCGRCDMSLWQYSSDTFVRVWPSPFYAHGDYEKVISLLEIRV